MLRRYINAIYSIEKEQRIAHSILYFKAKHYGMYYLKKKGKVNKWSIHCFYATFRTLRAVMLAMPMTRINLLSESAYGFLRNVSILKRLSSSTYHSVAAATAPALLY
jgi:hypothetical protein